MNTFSNHPSGAQLVAQYTIEQRVRDAEQRRLARAARAQSRPEKPATAAPTTTHVPWWVFRGLHPAH